MIEMEMREHDIGYVRWIESKGLTRSQFDVVDLAEFIVPFVADTHIDQDCSRAILKEE